MSEFALPIGTLLHSKSRDYKVVEELGHGGFGITYKVSSTIMVDNVPITTFFAVKEHFMKGCYRADDKCTVICAPTMRQEVEETRKDFIVEAKRLNKLSGLSQNIVRVNEVFEDYGTAYYVMQYLDGGEMSEHIAADGPMGEAQALAVITPIAKAVELIHKERLLHLDIKPDNIVLMTSPADGTQYPVLIDFGIAKHFNASGKPTSTHSAKGASDGYAPMEQYSSIDHFTPELDVYALGATLYTLLTGRVPKKAFDITEQDIEDALPPTLSKRTRKAIINAMAKLKEHRTPTVEKFLKSLEAEYTLPIGTLLRSKQCAYRITGINSETDSYIVYSARPAEKKDGRSLSATNSGTTLLHAGNKTRTIKQTDRSSATATEHDGYLVYELYVRKRYQRNEDGTVNGCSANDLRKFDEAKATFIPKGSHGRITADGLPLAESFEANGTHYFSRLLAKQPSMIVIIKSHVISAFASLGNYLSTISAKIVSCLTIFVSILASIARKSIIKPLSYILLAGVVIAGIVFGIMTLRKCSFTQPNNKTLISYRALTVDTISMPKDTDTISISTVKENSDTVEVNPVPVKTQITEEIIEKKEVTDEERYAQAKRKRDYTTLLALADKGYAKAYYDVAYYYYEKKNFTKAQAYAELSVASMVNIDKSKQLIRQINTILSKPVESTQPTVVQQPKEKTDAEKYSEALRNADWSSIKRMADNGYAPAYYPLANHYYQYEDLSNAEKYANKAINANSSKSLAQTLLDKISSVRAKNVSNSLINDINPNPY